MQELLAELARGLVKDPANVSVSVDAPDEDGVSVYHLHVSQDDMGRVIGKQGKIAKSIRTIMKATALRNGQKIQVEID
ncbi:MAG: KH domain-containing protein [Clostridia bacterium]|nr:KH domain-containing protein [Clostridia bacterium]MBR5428818.1 KH domain-containing protein [Clostridia bacterium]